jgi:hypothetical protein
MVRDAASAALRSAKRLGHDCLVVAPSLIPKKPGDRVKTNRRDALSLAKLQRAGELTAVWVPDARHEAMRDLTRAREAAVEDLTSKRQQLLSLLRRLGRHHAGKRNWTRMHMSWLASQKLDHAEQRIAFEEMLLAVREAQARVARREQAIRAALPDWLVASGGSHGIDGEARLRPRRGERFPGRDGRLVAVSDCAGPDGLSRPGTERAVDRREGQARRHHKGGQPSSTAHSGRVLVELPAAATARQGEPAPRDVREGATSPHGPLPGANPRNTGPMLARPRCGAKTRSDGRRRLGKKRYRMLGGAPGFGTPQENQNALTSRLYKPFELQ